MKPGKTGITRIIHACHYSWLGLKAAWKHEAAFRQELLLAIVLLPLSFIVGQSASQIALMILSVFLVLLIELINSALEAVVDRFGGEHHQLSGRAKDIGSAAVAVAILNLLLVWGVILVSNYF
ncbi:diacylglycerol kinase [Kangiella geojedonensis]|uniref:Diacylglycerol kinase n=1 Tax=Kangiella geojedonensis TaxID=914150 RepID=A0A0F6TPT6_9GAMM|nr:diacylglycerol kinase [Kangiella geojedonensis]AKE51435.1 diacylglycerol kinase [Kangiella geojedonensis]